MLNKRAELHFLTFVLVLLIALSHTLFYPVLSFLLALLAGWSLHSSRGSLPGQEAGSPSSPAKAPSPVLGSDVHQAQHGDSRNILGRSQLQSCTWFCYLQARARNHFILPFPGLHPAPEGSASRGLAQNHETNGISLKGNTDTIFHLAHLILVVWLAMKNCKSQGMKQ